jgi:hypothetical protein
MPFRSIALEMIGLYAGPRLGEVTLPDNFLNLATQLWEFSEELCEKILEKKNLFMTLLMFGIK